VADDAPVTADEAGVPEDDAAAEDAAVPGQVTVRN
jgi:hypothetical protein